MNPANPLPFQPENPGDANRFQVLQPVVETPIERSCRAWDHKLDREVLLKFPPATQWQEWSVPVRERIAREAKVMAKVRSDQVAQVYDVLQSDVGPVIVMEVPDGEPLAERLRTGTLSPAETKRIGIEIARALAALHLASVVYRALGPASVLVTANGKVKLADFTFAKNHGSGLGVASLPANMDRKSSEELRAQLPPYPAPEILSGRDAEPRGDLFSLGCLMYRCLAGIDPFAMAGDMQPVQDLRKARPDCPKELVEVVRKCMAMSKTARYATAIELEQALVACPDTVDVSRRNLLAAGTGAALLLAVGAYWLLREPVAELPDHKPGYGQLWALLVGVNRYDVDDWNTLRTAEADLDLVEKRLLSLGWEASRIRKLPRPARGNVIDAMRDLNQEIRKSGPDDALVVYFAGHGIQQPEGADSSVLLPADARKDVSDTWLAPEDFRRELRDPKHLLYVFDACHSFGMKGVLEEELGRGRSPRSAPVRTEDSLYLKHTTGRWRGLLYSARSKEAASDGTGNSPFCLAFCEALDPAGQLKSVGTLLLPEVSTFIQRKLTNNSQGPGMLHKAGPGAESDTFVFRLPKPGG